MSARVGNVAVVTGAARGIGRQIALTLADHDYAIAALDVDAGGVQVLVDELSSRGVAASAFAVDLADPAAITDASAKIASWGDVGALVNNAGILSTAQLEELRVDEWDRVMDINLRGTVFLSKEMLPLIATNGGGSVVNISSVAGRMGGQSTGVAYTASKAALIGLTMRFAREFAAAGVTVNAIAPGPAETEMAKEFTPAAYAALIAAIPIGRLIDPVAIAGTVAFLLSEPARYITGAVIDINGGMWMG